MSCPVLINPACIVGKVVGSVAGAAAGSVANDALSAIASAVASGVSWIVGNSVSWWVKVPSPGLAAQPAVSSLQQWMLPLSAAVAVLGLVIAGGKMTLTRKANPLIDVGSGLVIIAATSAVGVLLPDLLLQAGDAWSNWVLNASTGGQFGSRLTGLLSLSGVAAPAVVLVLGLIAILISAAQAILMLFRQASLVILAGVLPLAAAGTLTPATRTWFKKVTGWMLAIVFYKPAAAAVYAAAFTLIGTGKGAGTVLMGFAMVGLSLLALPVLMRLFTWTTGQVTESAAGGGFLQTAMSGTVALGALRGSFGGSGAAGQARLIADRLGPAGSGPSGAQSPGTGVRQAAAAPAPAASPPPTSGPASGAGTAAAGSSAGAGTAGASAAGGPAGVAVAGLAAGAATARRKATEAMQPPASPGGNQ
jgi:hypothetical protein